MADVSILHPRDIYLASHSSVYGIGGGVTVTEGLAAAFERVGFNTLILGVDDNPATTIEFDPGTPRLNLHSGVPERFWRFRNWVVPRTLGHSLAELPPPRRVFVGVNPLWIIAAKRAWPSVPIVFLFVALLSNCQPFTWYRRRPTFWQRINYASIRRAEHLALTLADRTITPTRQAREELEAFHPAARGRIEVCTYGAEPRQADANIRAAKRAELGLRDDDFLLLAVGVCDRNKAFDRAIREIPAVDKHAHLVIIGDGPEYNSLMRLTDELRIADRARLVGLQPDLDPWYAAADCVLSTSQYDTFPYVILDGMSYGRPVIVPRHAPPNVYAGLAEVITDHGGGLLYDRMRNGALAACLNRLIRDDESRASLGTEARDFAQRYLDWNTCVKLILGDSPEPPADAHESRTDTRFERSKTLVGNTTAESDDL